MQLLDQILHIQLILLVRRNLFLYQIYDVSGLWNCHILLLYWRVSQSVRRYSFLIDDIQVFNNDGGLSLARGFFHLRCTHEFKEEHFIFNHRRFPRNFGEHSSTEQLQLLLLLL